MPHSAANSWQAAYDMSTFNMTTVEPSALVCDWAPQVPPASLVADFGCGRGRNSIEMKRRGHSVHGYDAVDVGQGDPLAALGVKFTHGPVQDIRLTEGTRGAILAMRLFQYLHAADLTKLIQMAAGALIPGGLLIAAWTLEGGILDLPSVEVPKHRHSIGDVVSRIRQAGLRVHYNHDYWTTQQGNNLSGALRVCDLVAMKS